MPSTLVSALYHLNLLLDKFTFPSLSLYDWTHFQWQMNNQKLRQSPHNSFYLATICRVVFIAASLFCVFVLYPMGFLKLSEAVVSLTVSCMVFVTVFSDLLMLFEGPNWVGITNWLFIKDREFSIKTECCSQEFYILLINVIWKGKSYIHLNIKNRSTFIFILKYIFEV